SSTTSTPGESTSEADSSGGMPGTTAPATTDPATTDPATTDPATTDPVTTDPSGASESSGPAPAPICGDGSIHPREACDLVGPCSAAELDATDCTDLPSPAGPSFDGGALACNADCTFDTSACTYCGDGIVGGDELCDGDSNGAACSDAGYLGG